ncbi:hypothetical protein [Pseudanabaena sp. UWO310]|nr:hypothetical protein [Pseudanabaena sp. UWO310]
MLFVQRKIFGLGFYRDRNSSLEHSGFHPAYGRMKTTMLLL